MLTVLKHVDPLPPASVVAGSENPASPGAAAPHVGDAQPHPVDGQAAVAPRSEGGAGQAAHAGGDDGSASASASSSSSSDS